MLGLCIFGSALSEKSLVPNKLSEKFTDFSKNQPLEIMWMALSECFSTRVTLKKKMTKSRLRSYIKPAWKLRMRSVLTQKEMSKGASAFPTS